MFDTIIDVYEDTQPNQRRTHINYGQTLEKGISKIVEEIQQCNCVPKNISPRFVALKLLEKDKECRHAYLSNDFPSLKIATDKTIKRIETEINEDTETLITDAKYGFIAGALKETYKESPELGFGNLRF